jgi:CheY-like chemotaxis protein
MTSKLASIGELAAGVAHEINNPLTGVMGYAQLLMDKQDVSQDVKDDLQKIYEESQRAVKIVQNLLRFARRYKPEKEHADINDLLERTLELEGYKLRTSNISLTINLVPELPLILADSNQLQQVILNLITNAEQAMVRTKRKGKITVTTEKVKDYVRIAITDNGPGISPEHITRIFDPFFTTKEVGSGTGLGLSVSHGIITEHGGRIYAESESGKGATFIIELPVAVEGQQSAVEKEKKAAKAKSHRPRQKATGNILIVEDEPSIRSILTRPLSNTGHQAQAVSNGKTALRKLAENVYDLLIVDLKMSGLSGRELYEIMKKSHPNMAKRVVFITGDTVTPETHNFLVSTGRQYLSKPFNPREITDIIEKASAER